MRMLKAGKLLLVCLMAVNLAACSYFDAPPPSGSDVTIDLMNRQMAGQAAAQDVYGPGEPAVTPDQYLRFQSNRSVEVYPLEGDLPESAHVPSAQAPLAPSENFDLSPPDGISGQGVPSADPSVEVYPLQGASLGAYPGMTPEPRDVDEIRTVELGGWYRDPIAEAPVSEPQPRPSAASSPFPVRDRVAASERGWRETNIFFGLGETKPGGHDRDRLAMLAQGYNPASGVMINVDGHASRQSNLADEVERKAANLKISMQRAFEVAYVLMQAGIPADRLFVKGYGESVPYVEGGAIVDDKSRRVVVQGL